MHKYKTHLVAKGYSYQPGIDFTKTFAPIATLETIPSVVALATQLELEVFQLDVKSAFANEVLKDEVYAQPPQGFIVKGKEDKIYRLHFMG